MPAIMNRRMEKYLFMAEPSNTLEMRLPIMAPMNVPMVVNAATSRSTYPLRQKMIAPENAVIPIM